MRAGLGVEAFVGEAEALDGAAADEVLVDDFGSVFEGDVAVPDGLRVDDDGVAVLALIEAAGLVDPDPRRQAGGLGKLLDGGVEFALAVGVAGGARGVLGTGIGTDKDVAFKRGQEGLLRVEDRSRVKDGSIVRFCCSTLVSEFRFRTKIALPVTIPRTELAYESAT
jgi:hypothetical protein